MGKILTAFSFLGGAISREALKPIAEFLIGLMGKRITEETQKYLKVEKGGKGKADEIIYSIVNLDPIIREFDKYAFTIEDMKKIEGFMDYLEVTDGEKRAKGEISFLLADFILFIALGAEGFACRVDREGKAADTQNRDITNSLAFLKRLAMEPGDQEMRKLCDLYQIWDEHRFEKVLKTIKGTLKKAGVFFTENVTPKKVEKFAKDIYKKGEALDDKWAQKIKDKTPQRPGFLSGVFGKEKPKSIFDRFRK